MEAVTILPNMAQQEPRKTLGLNSYADDAEILLDEPKTVKKTNHFIEANTSEIDLKSLKSECIIPVFAKDNELTISHPAFIETAYDAATSFFNGERIETPAIQVSHVVKGRTPEAIHKPANQLLESDKTIYYERCAFAIDIPTIFETVGGNKLNLSIVGVRAYNRENLYSRKTLERFSVAIGFVNQVCCNMCVFTDGYRSQIEVSSTKDLYRALLELFNQYNPAKHLHLMQSLGNTGMTKHQFVTLLGRMRLYQCLPQGYQKRLPRMLLTDTQINSVARTYISDENFGSFGSELDMWRFYNLLTGANKSSYIDSFLDRSLNATEMAVGISSALHGDERYKWFID